MRRSHLHRNHLLHGHPFRGFHVVAYTRHHGVSSATFVRGDVQVRCRSYGFIRSLVVLKFQRTDRFLDMPSTHGKHVELGFLTLIDPSLTSLSSTLQLHDLTSPFWTCYMFDFTRLQGRVSLVRSLSRRQIVQAHGSWHQKGLLY